MKYILRPHKVRDGFPLHQLLEAAKSLEPVKGTEYARGVTELIGRALLNFGYGEGTGENAALVETLVCLPEVRSEP